MTNTLILGAGGIVGQHMRMLRPDEAYVRRNRSPGYLSCDLSVPSNAVQLLNDLCPDVIVNLAGENRVDFVDNGAFDDPTYRINVGLPVWAAEWCRVNGAHLVQVSTQGVFSGQGAPYGPHDLPHPITAYGVQKAEAERRVRLVNPTSAIVRSTFVLGVRPDQTMGRVNPLESMFATPAQRQVNDRWFSVAFATDVAELLWDLVDERSGGCLHLGSPDRLTRYDIARLANPGAEIIPASDDDFPGPRRPLDTTWNDDCLYLTSLEDGIAEARAQWECLYV